MAVCNEYGFNIPVDVCTNGPVGGGDSSQLRLQIQGNAASGTQVLTENNFSGSHTFNGWASGSIGGCTITGSSVTVSTTSNNDEVEVSFSVTVNSCSFGSDLYNDCGGAGPHTLTGSQTVPINVGGLCPF